METQKLKLDKFKHIGIFNFPDTIDLEIETAILQADVSVFLGKRMGFTIPL